MVVDKRIFILLGFFLIITSLSFADMNIVQFVNITTNQYLFNPNGTLLGWCNITDTDNSPMYIRYIWYKNGVSAISGQTAGTFSTSPALLHNFNNISAYYTETYHTPVQTDYYTNATSLNNAFNIGVHNGYAYVSSLTGNSITTFSLSNPLTPAQTNYYSNATSLNSPRAIAFYDGFMYVVSLSGNSLTSFNISNPATPVQTNYYSNATSLNGAFGIEIYNDYAYITSITGNSLTTFSLTNPATPVQTNYYSNATSLNSPRGLVSNNGFLYVVSLGGKSLTSFNISNPATPVQTDYQTDAVKLNFAFGIDTNNNFIYITSPQGNSLTTYNLTNPALPVQTDYQTDAVKLNQPYGIVIRNNFAYIVSYTGNSLTTYNLTNPALPVQKDYYTNATSLNNPYYIDTSVDFAYAVSYTGKSLTSFNLSDISSLTLNVGDNITLGCSGNDSIHPFVSAYSNSSQITIVDYDTTPPSIQFVAPTINSSTVLYVNTTGVNITATDTNLKNITIYLYNSTGLVSSQTATTSPLYYDFNLTTSSYWLNATAYDYLGNKGTTETRTFSVIYPPPALQFVAPTLYSGTFINVNYMEINATTLIANLTNITVKIYNSSLDEVASYTTNSSPNYANYSGLIDGLYYFNATSMDILNTTSNTETRNITVDTTPPSIQFVAPTSPSGTIQVANSININATATDTNLKNITVYLYNSGFSLLSSYTTATSPNYVVASGLSTGLYYFNAVAYDEAGNSINASMRNITITAPTFSTITITDYYTGLTNLVKLNIYALSTDTISKCDIRTTNSIDEDSFYWSKDYSGYATQEINQTIVFEKTDNYRVKLYCLGATGSVASTDLISLRAQEVIPDYLIWACLLGSVLLLIYAIKSENLFYGIFASLGFLVFVKTSEGAFLSEVESLVPVFFWIKVVYGVCLTLLIAQHFLKQAKSEIS